MKPYFTREDSLNYRQKLLSNIYPEIVSNLSKKYPALKKEKYQKSVFESRIIMIDDIHLNIHDFPGKQIVCPEYNYTPYYDIQKKLIEKYKVPADIFDDKELLQKFEDEFLPIHSMHGSELQQDSMMQNIIALYNTRRSDISKKDDQYFFKLIDVMKDMKKVDVPAIAKINSKLSVIAL